MSDNKLGFLSGDTSTEDQTPTPEPAAAPEPVQQAAPEPQPEGPARGPDGKFVSSASPPAPDPQAAPAAPPAPAAAEPVKDPAIESAGLLRAMMDEREKRQAEQARAQSLERKLAELQAAQQPSEAPNAWEDPQGAAAWQQQQLDERLRAQSLTISRRFAEMQYGAELVGKVHDWVVEKCDADPLFNAQMRRSDHPYEAAMQAFNREQILAKVKPDDLAQFEAWKAAQAAAGQGVNPVSQQPSVTPPPRSLNSAPSAGGPQHVATAPGSAFDGLFTR
jgi:hypothetical protein